MVCPLGPTSSHGDQWCQLQLSCRLPNALCLLAAIEASVCCAELNFMKRMARPAAKAAARFVKPLAAAVSAAVACRCCACGHRRQGDAAAEDDDETIVGLLAPPSPPPSVCSTSSLHLSADMCDSDTAQYGAHAVAATRPGCETFCACSLARGGNSAYDCCSTRSGDAEHCTDPL